MRNNNLPLHIKYRPQTFDEMVGNESTIESLKTIFSRQQGIPHAFLFTGPSGCGKTTAARIIAKLLKCSDNDFVELNMADSRGIDTIREIKEKCRYAPMSGKVKIYLLDEGHRQTPDSMSAMLKLLEDPPFHVYFIICTTDPEKILKTIKTRCSTFIFSSLQKAKILKLLKWVLTNENVDLPITILRKIADSCDGSARQALVLLDQVIDILDEEVALQTIIDNTVNEVKIVDLCKKLLMPGNDWMSIANIIKSFDEDAEKIRYGVLGYMNSILLSKDDSRAALVINEFLNSFMYTGKAGVTLTCYNIFLSVQK